MTRLSITNIDLSLIKQARQLIDRRYKPDVHAVGSALRTKSGNIFEGVHLEAYIGRIAVCAEAITIGTAATQGDSDIETIVAVYHTGKIVAPCGMCRELQFFRLFGRCVSDFRRQYRHFQNTYTRAFARKIRAGVKK